MERRHRPTTASNLSRSEFEEKRQSAFPFSDVAPLHSLANISIQAPTQGEETEDWKTVKGKGTLRKEERKARDLAEREIMKQNSGYLPETAKRTTKELSERKSQQGTLKEDYDPDFASATYKLQYKPKAGEKRNALGKKDDLIGAKVLKANSGQTTAPENIRMPDQRIFTTKVVGHDRQFDSEVKILENLRQIIDNYCSAQGLSEEDRKDIKGKVEITSKHNTCDSCKGVIEQFKERYPGVQVSAKSI